MAIGILLHHAPNDKIVGIQISVQPTTRTYTVNSSGNASFNFAGAVVQAVYKSGKLETISPTWSPQSGSITDTSTSKTVTVTATYNGFTATTTMTLSNPLQSIAITTQPTTRSYEVDSSGNATFSFAGAVITGTYKNSKTVTLAYNASGVSWSPGTGSLTTATDSSTVTVTATYSGKTATTTMTLTNPVSSIAITTQPSTKTYTVNSSGSATFNFASAVITVTHKNTKTRTVAYNASGVSWSPTSGSITNTNETASVTVTVTYSSKTATTTMTLNNPVTAVSVSPTSATYDYGATPSGTVTATLTNGQTKTVTATKSPATIAGNTTSVTYSYGGKSCSQTVTVRHQLLNSSNGSTWTFWVYNSSSTGGTSSVQSNGNLYMQASHWISSAGDMRAAYKKLTNCTRVKSITITYTNSKNDFNTAATWFAVGSTPTAAVYYSGNSSSGEVKATNVGGSAHSSTATVTFTWTTPTDLSNYYVWGKVTTQGADVKPTLTIKSVTALSA